MYYNNLLLRLGEIFLKGKNRSLFENKLVDNVKKITGIEDVKKLRGRLVINYFPNHYLLKRVFGLVSYSPVIKVEKDVEKIKKNVLKVLNDYFDKELNTKLKTFKIETKRSDKSFPIKSPEMNVLVGKYVEENSNFEFDFNKPSVNLGIEINQDATYLFLETISCFGGLPTGVEGKVLLLVEHEASLLAGLLFMKRGCTILPVAFAGKNEHSNKINHEEIDVSLLQKYSPHRLKLKVVKDSFELEKFAKENKIEVLVSSQTFENYKEYSTSLLVFRPLIAFSEKEIKEKLEKFSFD